MKLGQADFAHNHATNCSTRFSQFQVVYLALPRGPLNLVTLLAKARSKGKTPDFVRSLQDIRKTVLDNLTTINVR